jgi:hypothetical protein
MRRRLLAAIAVLTLSAGAGAAMVGYCSPTVIDGRVDSYANPNFFRTSGYYHCIAQGTTPCSIMERALILRYSPALKDWVRVSDTRHYSGLACDASTGWVNHDYPVGSGMYEIQFEVYDGDITGRLLNRWVAVQTFP